MVDSTDSKKDEEDNKNLEDYYKFDRATDKQLEDGQKLSYFEEVKNLIPVVKKAAKKADAIRKQLQKKIKDLEKELKKRQGVQQNKAKNNDDEDLMHADLCFCRGAIGSCDKGKSLILEGQKDLEDILATRAERNYSVIVDVALMPLPSSRAKQKGKDKGGKGDDENDGSENFADNNGKKTSANDNQALEDKNSGKLTPEQLAALRGTPEKATSAKVNEGISEVKEQGKRKETTHMATKADIDKIWAARNGIAPENIGKETKPHTVSPREIDFTNIPKTKGHTR